MKSIKKILASLFILLIFSLGITSCDVPDSGPPEGLTVEILNGNEITMKPGEVVLIETNIDGSLYKYVRFIAGADCITVDQNGLLFAHTPGQAMVIFLSVMQKTFLPSALLRTWPSRPLIQAPIRHLRPRPHLIPSQSPNPNPSRTINAFTRV